MLVYADGDSKPVTKIDLGPTNTGSLLCLLAQLAGVVSADLRGGQLTNVILLPGSRPLTPYLTKEATAETT